MELYELLMIAVGLSMDAFAVAICKGLSMRKMNYGNAIKTGCFFGGFQALMPTLGYFLGAQFKDAITSVDHWITFALLSIIGINMIRESRDKECDLDSNFSLKSMLALSVATSIDALAIGVTFAFLQVNIVQAVSIIGTTTFLISLAGVKIGNAFGCKFKSKAELTGGIILIAIGIKILLEHLGVI